MIPTKIIFKYKSLFFSIFSLFILIIYFNQILFKNNIYAPGDFLRSDTINQNLPFKYQLYNSLQNNKLPFWIDTIYKGFPLVAEGEVGAFYPLNIIFFKALSFIKAYNYLIFLNILIIYFGTYLFARTLKLSSFSSMFLSLVFSLSSFFILHITHQNILTSAAWLPWIFLFNYNLFEKRRIEYFILACFTLVLSILAGSIQIAFYISFSNLICLLFFRKKFQINLTKIITIFLLEVIVAILLSSIQLLPTFELLRLSVRSQGLGNIALDSLPFHPRNLFTLFFPYIFGDPGLGTYPRFGGNWGMFWENTAYIGLLPLLFAFVSLKNIKKRKFIKIFWLLLLISLLLVLGKYSPLFWIYYLPVFNSFRVTSRFLLVFLFYLSLLSGFGIQFIISNFKENSNKIIISCFIVIFTLFDLFIFGYKYNPLVEANEILKIPENGGFIKKDGSGRIFSLASTIKYDQINSKGWRNNFERIIFHKNALDPDINILWNIKSIDGYAGLYLEDNQELIGKILKDVTFNNEEIGLDENSLKLLGFSNVEYIISPYKITNLKITRKEEKGIDEYYIYKNPYFIQRGILVDSIDFNYTSLPLQQNFKETVLKLKDETDNLVFEINSKSGKWFVLQDTYYPGWKAYLNGKEVDIHKFNKVYRAVKIPSGNSTLEFKYVPRSYFLGRNITLATLIGVISLIIFSKLLIRRDIFFKD
jgi:hypothetical protein